MSGFKKAIDDLRDFDIADLTNIDTIGYWPGPVKFVLVLFVIGG